MKYLGSGGEPNSELFSKLLGKRPASLDLSSSLKYLDDSIFNKRKKSKKFKGKREEEEFKLPALYKNEESLKLEQPFQGYFNQNKMLTNFPNNQPNFSNIQEQTNNFNNNHGFVSNNNTNNEPFNELFQNYPVNCYNNSNINPAFSGGSLGGFLEGGLGLSRRNSLNEEFQDNYNFTGNMNMESPLRSNNYAFSPLLPNISSLGRNPIKDEVLNFFIIFLIIAIFRRSMIKDHLYL